MKAVLLLLSIFVSSEASVIWKDCVPSTTAHPYVTFTSVTVSPSPVVIPGNVTIGVQGTVHHHFGTDVKMVVHMDKYLLGVWTKVPCSQNVGSCNYDNPCEFLSAFKSSGTCPAQLTAHGLPCTCPFNPSNINLPPSVFEVTQISQAWQWLATGKFRVQAEMIHGQKVVGCFHVEMDIKRSGHSGGFLFG
ncbi:ganglioside GM2 activator-like [Ostrea edulis]|uniref:ganglioside GM2 activator-like n=1 Tax=Ostrea edulis TaxID=37623 RepID=UPI0024AFE065|nr:ganglioside GM2 activator-like [Ostrea edulis]